MKKYSFLESYKKRIKFLIFLQKFRAVHSIHISRIISIRGFIIFSVQIYPILDFNSSDFRFKGLDS